MQDLENLTTSTTEVQEVQREVSVRGKDPIADIYFYSLLLIGLCAGALVGKWAYNKFMKKPYKQIDTQGTRSFLPEDCYSKPKNHTQ